MVHATDTLIYYARAQGWRDPCWMLLLAAARCHYEHPHRRGGFASLAHRGWRIVQEWYEEERAALPRRAPGRPRRS